jgi:predicted Ser/Thr protein kinase
MEDASRQEPAAAHGADRDLYDEYLDACLAGEAVDPAAFLARHDCDDADLLVQLRALYASQERARQPSVSPRPPEPLPERIGRYTIRRLLGEGGMGHVYLAEDERLGREVALKVMRAALGGTEVFERRFEREARAVAKLQHPNIVRIHELGTDGPLRFIAMERVEGRSLDAILAEGRPALDDALRWGSELARALAYAHAHGVVHRDVKPSNVMIRPTGEAVLLDFGMVHLTDLDETRLTQTFAGSPGYAAPEQIQNGTIDERTDVYALGVTLYECLTGTLPFPGSDLILVFRRVLTEPPPSIRIQVPDAPRGLDLVIQTCLEKRPADRYADGIALAEDLLAVRSGETVAARRPGWVRRAARFARRRPAVAAMAGTVVLALMGFAGWLAVDAAHRADLRRQRARQAVERALALVESFRRSIPDDHELEQRIQLLKGRTAEAWVDEAADEEYEILLDERDGRRAKTASMVADIHALLIQAQRDDNDVQRLDEVRARLALEQRRVAVAQGDVPLARHFDELVRRHDPEGLVTGGLDEPGRLRFQSTPRGAQVHLWRMEEHRDLVPGGDRRWVPVPHRGSDPHVTPGETLLRVVQAAPGFSEDTLIRSVDGHPAHGVLLAAEDRGEVRRGDHLVRIDDDDRIVLSEDVPMPTSQARRFEFRRGDQGIVVRAQRPPVALIQPRRLLETPGCSVEVLRGERGWVVEQVEVPLVAWPTATPLPVGSFSACGNADATWQAIAPGRYLARMSMPGRTTVRYAFRLRAGEEVNVDLVLPPADAAPPGFVFLSSHRAPCWIMAHEVTARQYLEFLRDPATRAAIDAAGAPLYYPRAAGESEEGGRLPWRRGEAFTVPEDFALDWPILGVSWTDAMAYARWRSRREGRTYRLPTWDEWGRAAGAYDGREYVCGMTVREKWIASCFSRPRALPANVLSYPIDESPLGVYDMAGNALEWCDHWFDENRGFRQLVGNSWGHRVSGANRIFGGLGKSADRADYDNGFRLVLDTDG